MHKVLVLLATARINRRSAYVANFIKNSLEKKEGFDCLFLDIADFSQNRTLGLSIESSAKWQDALRNSDSLLIVSPEYNHSFPGELKLLLDSELELYEGKPVAICGVSMGDFGGVRMIEQLKLVLQALDFNLVYDSLMISNVDRNFLDTGEVINEEKWEARLQAVVNSLKAKTI